MDLLIAISQGLGLAVAAGFLAAAPLALASTTARLGFAHSALSFAGDPITLAVTWVLTVIEIVTDVIWPGAQGAGAMLVRRIIGGGLAFELVAGKRVPFVGLIGGAVMAGLVAIALREVRARAVKGGGDLRGTAVIEDGAGLVASVLGCIPYVGYPMALGGLGLFIQVRRRDREKYKGLRVLR
jgi:uncharacterized membrane protein